LFLNFVSGFHPFVLLLIFIGLHFLSYSFLKYFSFYGLTSFECAMIFALTGGILFDLVCCFVQWPKKKLKLAKKLGYEVVE